MNKRKDEKTSSYAMSRRDFLKFTGGTTAAAFLANGFFAEEAKAVDYVDNILLITTDQHNYEAISALGCTDISTPNLDRLISRGKRFELSYCTSAVCSPSRSSIYTGFMPSETKVYVNSVAIASGIDNLGEWFRDNSTLDRYYIGKWHIPNTSSLTIDGFTVLSGCVGGQGNLDDSAISREVEGFLWNRTPGDKFLLACNFLQPHDICEWLRLNEDVPASLRYPSLSGNMPSLPSNFTYDEDEPQEVKLERDENEPVVGSWTNQHWQYYMWSYYRHVEMVDAEIGRVLQALEDSGLASSTLVVYTADHGEGLAHHQTVRKSQLYEESVKVPLIFSWPGHISQGTSDTTHLVSGIDIMPTLCDFAGISAPAGVTGSSLRPFLDGTPGSWRSYLVCERPGNDSRSIRSSQYKYVAYMDDPIDQLFDLSSDPGETVNLANDAAYDSTRSTLREALVTWESGLSPDVSVPNQTTWWYTGISAPTFVAAGAVANNTGAITPALPAGIAANDILLLFLETSNQAISISNQNGGTWTEVTNSPQYCGTAASSTGSRLTAFWSRYNGTQGAPTTSDSGDHQLGRMIAIRGAAGFGNPWNITAGGTEAVSDTSGSIPGATTTVPKTLVVVAIAASLPDASSTANFSSWTNANLTSLTERTDNSVTSGNGGGLGIATGVKTTAGAYGNTTVTLANAAYKSMMSIAIKP